MCHPFSTNRLASQSSSSGCVGSSPWEPPWSVAEHVGALVETLGTAPSAWIGHSFGGRLAFEIAARHPEAVERLVLLDPALLIDPTIAANSDGMTNVSLRLS